MSKNGSEMAGAPYTMEECVTDQSDPLEDEAYAAVVMLIIFSVIGVAGNALVLYGFSMLKPKMTSTIFILTLAGIDFTSCLVTIPATVAMELAMFRVPYDPLCKAYHFLVTSTIPFSAFVMVAIAVDRYYCICKPFIQIMTKFRAKVIVLSLSVLALIIGFVSCLNFGVVTKEMDRNITNETLEIRALEALLPPNDTFLLAFKKGKCAPAPVLLCGNPRNLGETFYEVYNIIYASIYATCGIVVIILYVIIYHFILSRRQRRLRTESFPCCTFSKQHGESENTDFIYISQDTQNTTVDDAEKDANLNSPLAKQNNENHLKPKQSSEITPKLRQKKKKNHRKSDATSTFRLKQERIRVNNIKTALVLSVVALVFIAAFLPAWLMKHRLVPFNVISFYMYFVYNVANPFIYAFMNPDFRQKMAIVGKRIKTQLRM